MTLRRRRGLLRRLLDAAIDWTYSLRHWWRWKVRQRPHAGWPESVGFFVVLAVLGYLLVAFL